MQKKTVRDIDVAGKRIFVRVDFNVPFADAQGEISDDTRIRAALPTIKYLTEKGARVVLASHLGRPKGKVVDSMRLGPVARRLSELLEAPVVGPTTGLDNDGRVNVTGIHLPHDRIRPEVPT